MARRPKVQSPSASAKRQKTYNSAAKPPKGDAAKTGRGAYAAYASMVKAMPALKGKKGMKMSLGGGLKRAS